VNNDDFCIIFESFIKKSRRRPNVKQGINTSENAEKFHEDAEDQLKTTWDPETLGKSLFSLSSNILIDVIQGEILARLVSLNDDQTVQLYIALSKRLHHWTT
jgi:hypothetical protein